MRLARLFIVDDEIYILQLYEELLAFLGHDIIDKALNGEEAVLRYQLLKPPPDVVLMDHRMPFKNGLEATREILEFDPGATIIVVSADRTIGGEALGAGAVAYVEKPFAIEELEETIESAMRRTAGGRSDS
jgi:two-component system chemotaxis response regulator CheY